MFQGVDKGGKIASNDKSRNSRYLVKCCVPSKKARLVDPGIFDRLPDMRTVSERKAKEVTVADLFPGLSENELKEVEEALDAYCSIALQIFTRIERERRETFDGPTTGS
jgi:hypothetical protein